MNPAANLALIGPMGSGKSCIGRRLAERFGLRFVDADREIEANTGVSIATIFEIEGEAGFRARERGVLAELLAGAESVIATGGGAILDADTRQLLRERSFVVHLDADVEQLLARLARDRSRPLLAGDDREQVLRDLVAVRAPLYAKTADLRFETGEHPPAEAAARLGHLLETCWQRHVNHTAIGAREAQA